MDLSYILHNTLVYGIMAFVLARILSHNKYLSFVMGAALIWVSYVLQSIFSGGFQIIHLIHIIFIFIVCYSVDVFIYKSFRHEYIRDLFGLIFTMGFSIVIVNGLPYVYGPNPISIELSQLSNMTLFSIIFILQVIIYYIYGRTLFGKVSGGVHENSKIVETLAVKRVPINFSNMLLSFVLIIIASYVILTHSSLGAGDDIFYAIKGVGILIIVGTHRLEYMFIGALGYVVLEHILFINLGFPLQYKESMVLFVILAVLMWRPQGIFSFNTRKI